MLEYKIICAILHLVSLRLDIVHWVPVPSWTNDPIRELAILELFILYLPFSPYHRPPQHWLMIFRSLSKPQFSGWDWVDWAGNNNMFWFQGPSCDYKWLLGKDSGTIKIWERKSHNFLSGCDYDFVQFIIYNFRMLWLAELDSQVVLLAVGSSVQDIDRLAFILHW